MSDYAAQRPRRFAVSVMLLLMTPLLVGFGIWFLWAVSEFFEEQPSFDYFFWIGLIVGGGATFWVIAAMLDLWKRQIKGTVNESHET